MRHRASIGTCHPLCAMSPRDLPDGALGSATTELDSRERPREGSADLVPALPPAFASGAVLADRYRIVRFLARGGMGEVYEAEDLLLHMSIALKSIAPEAAADAKMVLRLKREVLLARKVTNPHVCRLHDLGTHATDTGPVIFLTMDLLRGETLAAYVARRTRLTVEEALPLVRDMASALDAAHRAGVIHRDFKSRNVIVVERGGRPTAVVMDFGIAIAAAEDERGAHETGEGRFIGTPAYMAPEQVSGRPATAATDVYAFGVVLFEMMTGRMPFASDRVLEAITMRLTQSPPRPKSLVPALDGRWNDVILRCLAREPAARFASAQAAVGALVAPTSRWTRWPARVGGSVAVAGLAAIVGARWMHAAKAPAAAPPVEVAAGGVPAETVKRRPTLAVMSMRNAASDPAAQWVSSALSDMYRSELQADEALRVVPGDRVARARADLGLPRDQGEARFGQETLARIRENLAVDYVLTGRYETTASNQLRVQIALDDARSGERVLEVAADGSPAKLVEVVAAGGASIRKKLGLREPSAAESTAARAASPATPDAAKAYAEGEAKLATSDLRGALESFHRAVAADPAFPLAHAGLAMAASALGDDPTALEQARRAFETSSGLAREEQLAVEARYRGIAKEWGRAADIWRTLFAFSPDNVEYGLRYAQALWAAGRPNDAFPVIAALRALPAPEKDDPRIDYYESIAAAKISDFRRMAAAGSVAARKAERAGAWSIAAHGHHQVAEAHAFLREPDAAIPEWEKASEEYARIADRQGEADSLKGLGDVYVDSGDPGRALPMQERALALTREIGSRYKIANGVQDVGSTRYALGDSAAARARFDEARGLYEAIHDREGIGNALGDKALTLWDDGDLAGARAMASEGRARLREVGERDGVTSLTIDLAAMALDAGDLREAAAGAAEGEGLAKDVGVPFYATRCTLVRAEIARDSGDIAGARRLGEEAREGFVRARAGGHLLDAQVFLARIALEDDGRATDAEARAREAADAAHAGSLRPVEAAALAVLARSLSAQNNSRAAAEAIDRAAGLGAMGTKAKIDLAVARASLLEGSPDRTDAARKELEEARSLVAKSAFVERALEVRLALARLAHGAQSRAAFEALAADATAKGLTRIARVAQAEGKLVVSAEQSAPRGDE